MKTTMTIKKVCVGLVIMLSLFVNKSFAQIDPHFSQYYAYPLWLNPALTGVIDGDYRVGINLRQQWSALNNAFITGGASFDMAASKNLSFGATIMDQKAGELNFNHLTALVSGAYRIRFGSDGLNIVNFGLQAGIINRSFDLSNARFGDQYENPAGTMETFQQSSSLTPDVNLGIMYFDGNPNQSVNPFMGVSVSHINRPVEKFLGNRERMPMRFAAHGGARVKVNPSLDLMPNALFMYQGNAHEIVGGGYAQIMASNNSHILIGANYRFKDALIGYVGFLYKNMSFGISYDVNTSNLQQASNYNGGFELSVSLIGRKGLIAPDFFCPRL